MPFGRNTLPLPLNENVGYDSPTFQSGFPAMDPVSVFYYYLTCFLKNKTTEKTTEKL